MNNHPEYPYLTMGAGRIQALLDGWNAADVAAFASADEFADAFYDAEFVVDPAAAGRDDDLDADEILERARKHWQASRAELANGERLRQLNKLFPVRAELAQRCAATQERWVAATDRNVPRDDYRAARAAAKAAELALVEFDEAHPEVIEALNRFVANRHA